MLAKRPAIADFLVGEGALPTVANLVATGPWQTSSQKSWVSHVVSQVSISVFD